MGLGMFRSWESVDPRAASPSRSRDQRKKVSSFGTFSTLALSHSLSRRVVLALASPLLCLFAPRGNMFVKYRWRSWI